MYEIRQCNYLPFSLRQKVNLLIYEVWSQEAKRSGDVRMSVAPGSSVHDTIDLLSTHVLVLRNRRQLIGYGRVSLLPLTTSTEGIPLKTHATDGGTTAYFSRLVIHPRFQRQGVAKIIHRQRIKIALDLGASQILAWAIGENPKKNLTSFGFKAISKKKGFRCAWYATSRMTALMRLKLEATLIFESPKSQLFAT